MSEDLTQNLPDSFERRVLAEFAAMRTDFAAVKRELSEQHEMLTQVHTRALSLDARLSSLEDKVDARLRETRPIWEGVQLRLTNIESELSNLNRQFRSLLADIFQVRVRVEKLEDAQQSP
jgi:predicted nuclease with TOPRIM domain